MVLFYILNADRARGRGNKSATNDFKALSCAAQRKRMCEAVGFTTRFARCTPSTSRGCFAKDSHPRGVSCEPTDGCPSTDFESVPLCPLAVPKIDGRSCTSLPILTAALSAPRFICRRQRFGASPTSIRKIKAHRLMPMRF